MALPSHDLAASLSQLFDAERSVRRLHASLAKSDPPALLDAVSAALDVALEESDEDEAALRLVRLAHVLSQLEGPRAVDLLIDILGSEEPEARAAAGEELSDLAFDRFKEVALGVERALERLPAGSPALLELPYILAEIGEPGVRKLLGRFLAHGDAEAVAAAIEALVEMADAGAAPLLRPLEDDPRTVNLEDEGGEEGTVTLGELAREASALLSEIDDPAAQGGGKAKGPKGGGR